MLYSVISGKNSNYADVFPDRISKLACLVVLVEILRSRSSADFFFAGICFLGPLHWGLSLKMFRFGCCVANFRSEGSLVA